ncbi:globin [Dehalococcoidia bacterium]|nr:globin [Dehalococcoidia bacterium]
MSDSNNNPDLNASPDTMYHRVGGQSFFVELVDKFYEFVERDTGLRSMYPADLTPGKSHLAGFLSQYWGGPADYSAERGHPRLRMRHIKFSIGNQERNAWIKHMKAALDLMSISSKDHAIMLNYFENTATMMINR